MFRRYDEAERLLKRVVAIQTKALGPEHPELARSLYNLAVFYLTQYLEEEAVPNYRQALGIMEKAFGPEHSKTKTMRERYEQLLVVMRTQGK